MAGQQEPKEKGDSEPGPVARSLGPKNILERDEDDAAGDHWFDDERRQPEEVERREGERDRVRQGKGGNDLHQLPQTAHTQHECCNEKKVIVAGENVEQPVMKISTEHLPAVEARRRCTRWR